MKRAIYPGTFDPVTNGHIDIAERACKLYDEVIIAVAAVSYKDTLFSVEERVEMMRESVKHIQNARVESFNILLVEYAKQQNARAMIRGLRAITDFEYEMQLASMNKRLNNNLETLFLMTSGEYSFLSSSMIKQVAMLGGNVRGLVPELVYKHLCTKYHLNE
ncbi:MAG: pantetheine-phosphate adenylyltransferase [Desulfocucumaceae bacterium]